MFKDNLKKFLEDRGISQVDFAARIGISKQVVTNYLHGRVYPSLEVLEKIKEIYGVDLIGDTIKETELLAARVLRDDAILVKLDEMEKLIKELRDIL